MFLGGDGVTLQAVAGIVVSNAGGSSSCSNGAVRRKGRRNARQRAGAATAVVIRALRTMWSAQSRRGGSSWMNIQLCGRMVCQQNSSSSGSPSDIGILRVLGVLVETDRHQRVISPSAQIRFCVPWGKKLKAESRQNYRHLNISFYTIEVILHPSRMNVLLLFRRPLAPLGAVGWFDATQWRPPSCHYRATCHRHCNSRKWTQLPFALELTSTLYVPLVGQALLWVVS